MRTTVERPPRLTLRPSRVALLALAALLVAGGAVILHAGRDTSFFFDEWNFITLRRGVSAETLLGDHNGHLSLIPVAIYKVMLQVVGLGDYWPYRLVLVLVNALSAVLVFELTRRRAGDVAGVCAAALLFLLGASYDDLLWAFQIGFACSIAAGLGMLLALDREDARGDVLAAVLLLATLASSSAGVPFAVVCVADLALRRRWDRLLRVAAPPLALYALWRLGYGHSDLHWSNLDDAPAFAFQMLAAAVGGLSGLGVAATGPTLAVVAIAGFAVVLGRGVVTPRLPALLLGAVALWALTALARAQLGEPQAPRYILPSATLILLAALELWPAGLRLAGRPLAVVVGLTAVAVLGGIHSLNAGGDILRSVDGPVRAELTALEIAGDRAPYDFQPDGSRAPQVRAGPYRGAVAAFGSPALTEAELAEAPGPERQAADDVLRKVELRPLKPAPVQGARACRIVAPGGETELPRAGVRIVPRKGDVAAVRLRRFADGYPQEATGFVAGGGASVLSVAPDGSARPWRLQIAGVTQPVRVCAA